MSTGAGGGTPGFQGETWRKMFAGHVRGPGEVSIESSEDARQKAQHPRYQEQLGLLEREAHGRLRFHLSGAPSKEVKNALPLKDDTVPSVDS